MAGFLQAEMPKCPACKAAACLDKINKDPLCFGTKDVAWLNFVCPDCGARWHLEFRVLLEEPECKYPVV